MPYSSSIDIFSLEKTVAKYRHGGMTRRSFINAAMSLGVTGGMAGALATAWGGKAVAQSSKTSEAPNGEYDYIVIGSGSGGAACVHQLAKSGASILVLEAGRNDDLEELHDPRRFPDSWGTEATKWFETLPAMYSDGRSHLWPRGNVLGGSSAINAMIFVRGHKTDFDNWVDAGATGWGYEDVLPYFMEMESFEPGGKNRGTDGPLFVTQPKDGHKHEGAQAFMDATSEMGFKENPSFNSDRMTGQAWIDFNIKDQRRQSAATAYLRPVMDMGNVTVFTDAPVQKLNLAGTKCTGVTYLHNGKPVSVNAAQEVVLCAGAIDSPRLLMVSGIGVASDLAEIGIKAVVDLPVGVGLQDHIMGAGCSYEAKGPVPVSHYNHSEVYMWERSDSSLKTPDIVALYVSIPLVSSGHKLDYEHGYTMLSGLSAPKSRGYVKLASADIADAPIIETNYLQEEQDWKSYRAATELAREIGAHQVYNEFRKRETLPQKDGDLTDAEWRQFLAASVQTYFHPTSTCQIGKVVDPELRVKGIEGLRIADASVMPSITTGNTNAPSIMIGWRAGSMIASSY
jgi:choline dehydrogenase